MDATPLYPAIHIRPRSHSSLALVSAVRLALRRAGADREEIERFTREALAGAAPLRVEELCCRWVRIDDTPPPTRH